MGLLPLYLCGIESKYGILTLSTWNYDLKLIDANITIKLLKLKWEETHKVH